MQLSFEKRIVICFLLVFLLITILGFITYKNGRDNVNSSDLIAHSLQVLYKSDQTLSAVQEIETGVRGYVISGDSSFLSPLVDSEIVIYNHLHDLKELTLSNRGHQTKIDSVKKLIDLKIKFLRQTLVSRNREGYEAAAKVVSRGTGKYYMDEIRDIIKSIQIEESNFLVQQNKANAKSEKAFATTFYILLVAGIVFLFTTFFVIAINLSQRKKADEQITQMNQMLEKRVEEKTREVIEKEKTFRTLLDNMLEGVQIISPDWRYLYVNNTITKQSSYAKEELLGQSLIEKFPGFENTPLYTVLHQCMHKRSAKRIEVKIKLPNNSKGWFDVSIQPVPEGLFVVSVDITERKNHVKELLKTRKHLEHLLDSSPVVIYSAQAVKGYAFTYVSENIKGQLGYEPQEFLEFGPFWANNIHSEDFESVFSHLHHLFENGQHNMEYRFLHKNGTYRWIVDEMKLVRDEHGNPMEVVGAWIDITDRKNDDIKLKEAIRTSQMAYAELEQFAYMVSHDLQEPLRMVTGFLNLLKLEAEEQLDDESKEYIHFAIDGAERMKILIHDLLQYSRVGSNKESFTEVNVDEVLKYALQVLGEKIYETKAQIKANPMPVITGNKTLLNQLLINLLENALKYRSSDKQPEIEIGNVEEPDKWIFYVKDNGIGIDPKYFEKIFIIFQRVHARSEYSGTGIGLAICKKIVEKHGGDIWVESEEGKGSTFFFSISKNIIQ